MLNLAPAVTRRHFLALAGAFAGAQICPGFEPEIVQVAAQPYFAGVKRAVEALAKLGAPIAVADTQQIDALSRQGKSAAVGETEKILDRYTLARLSIDADGTGHIAIGGA